MLDERRVDLCRYRLKNSEDSLMVAEDCLAKGLYKDVIAYFNKAYAATERIPREVGRKVAHLQQKREKSDYDDFYIASKEETNEQVENTKQVIAVIRRCIDELGL